MKRHFVRILSDGRITERIESDINDAMRNQPDILGLPEELQVQIFGISDMPALPCLARRIHLAIEQSLGYA